MVFKGFSAEAKAGKLKMPKSLHKLSFKEKQKIARKERADLSKLAKQIKKIQKISVNKMTKTQASKMNKLISQYIKLKENARYN
jgi:predicted GTPase